MNVPCCPVSGIDRGRMLRQLFLITAFVLFAQQGRSWGDELTVTPFAQLKEEYNDNVFYASNNKRGSLITTIAPGLELTERNERLEATFSARLDSIIYAAQSSMNSLDQGYRGKASYRLSPRVNLETGAEFVQDSRADRDIGMSGLAILETFNAVKLDRSNYSLAGSYALDETTTANLSYNFGSDHYHDPKFTDITSHAVTLGLDHDLGRLVPNIKGGLTAGFTRYLFINSVVDNYTLAAGLQGELNELWTVSASLGGRLTQSMIETTGQVEFYPSFRSVTQRTVDTNPGWIGQLALAYHGEQSSGGLTYYRDVTSASGRSGTAERNALVLDVGRRFSYGLWGNLTAAVYLNQSEQRQFSNQPIDETTIDINPGLRYEFTKDMDLGADYHFQRVNSRQSSGEVTVDRNSVLLTFTYRYPFLE